MKYGCCQVLCISRCLPVSCPSKKEATLYPETFLGVWEVTPFTFLLALICEPLMQQAGFPCGLAGKESTRNAGDLGLVPGLGRSPGEGKGYPLQYSDVENSMDCIVHGVTKSRTRLSGFHFHATGWRRKL